jgi:hypothetical protein
MTMLRDLPSTSAHPAPHPDGASPISSIRLHSSSHGFSPPTPVRRAFGRGFLDRKDPFEASGRLLRQFTFSNSYDLNGEPPQAVADEIHARLQQQLADGNLKDTQLSVVDFDDASQHSEPARRFFVTQTTTRRETVVTVNAYLCAYGDHLYYSVRSYLLPILNIWKLLLVVSFTLFALAFAAGADLGLLMLAILAGVVFHLRKFMIDLAAGDPLSIALRKLYPGGLNSGTFDADDATAFLKTNVSLMLGTVATVLEKHGVDTGGLRTTIQRLEVNNISTGGGSIIGAAIGGIANQVAAEVRL